jgi:two-component system cell cycle sensor histidine kinase/response regulator CckA
MEPDARPASAAPRRGRRPRDAAGDDARRLVEIIEELEGLADTDVLLDRLTEHAARIAGYGAALLSLALPEGALVGTWNLPEEDRVRFKRRALKTNIDYRIEKRRRIARFAFEGTGICFVPHDVDLDRAPLSEGYLARPRTEGTWHPKDRLFILVRGSAGREIGIYSLDYPDDGNAPREADLGRLRLAERLLRLGGHLVQTRLLEQTLRRGEEEMRALVADAPVGIYRSTDAEGLVSANQRLSSIFGYGSPEEMLADEGAKARIEPPEVAAAVAALAEGEEMASREVDTVRRDSRPLRIRLTARRLPSRGYVLGIVEDVTEASQLADQLSRARRLEAVGTLASGIAHDFNNILCAILGYASLLRERSSGDGPEARSARAIEDAAVRGAELTRRLLGISRESPVETAAVDVSEVLADCGRIALETFDRRIEVAVDPEPGLPAVTGRTSDLHQAVLNLCINARDAMPRGGRLRLSAARSPEGPRRPDGAAAPGEWVRIDVEDEGEGMEPATLARLFEPFFTTKQRGKGTGLGLYMVYTTVQAHGGTVDVESTPGRGTRFRIHLPAGGGAGAKGPPPVPAPVAAGVARPGRVLVVEDEEMIRNLALAVLRSQGHEATGAADGEKALALLEAPGAAFDLVVLDLVLPRLSGPEVFRRLRLRHPALPVLLSSGNVDEGLLDQDLRQGIAGVLPKPYRTSELVSAVARVIGNAAPR